MLKPITIVGGGLAGLSLGIALRRSEIPVTIYEAGNYPRHRVCGEFISGRGQATLSRLGLLPYLMKEGAREARSVAFFAPDHPLFRQDLPQPALCLARYHLDCLLSKIFEASGGTLKPNSRWTAEYGAGIVKAIGRRPAPSTIPSRWFGMKIHVRHLEIAADLELHITPQGYVGLCKLNPLEVNVCGLFRHRALPHAPDQPWALLSGGPGSILSQRFMRAEVLPDSFCSVGALDLTSNEWPTGCLVGDALTMTPPITGNGMSMAFESAELAAPTLAAYATGLRPWNQAQSDIRRATKRLFTRRLRFARAFHALLLTGAKSAKALGYLGKSKTLWRFMFALTR